MFGVGLIVGGVLGGAGGIVFAALLVAGKREDEQMAKLFAEETQMAEVDQNNQLES